MALRCCVTDTVLGSNSEVGTLRVVILHGRAPNCNAADAAQQRRAVVRRLPGGKAQQEHDAFADVLRSRGVEVLLLADPLTEALAKSGGPHARHRRRG